MEDVSHIGMTRQVAQKDLPGACSTHIRKSEEVKPVAEVGHNCFGECPSGLTSL